MLKTLALQTTQALAQYKNGLTNAPKNARVLPIEVQPFEHTIAVLLQYPTLKHKSNFLDSPKTREDSGLVYKWSGNLFLPSYPFPSVGSLMAFPASQLRQAGVPPITRPPRNVGKQ
jgi:hypothetical protein